MIDAAFSCLPTPQGCYNFTSGWVESKGKSSWRRGKFAARARLPSGEDPSQRGVWPALWLMPDNDSCWPTGGEVDIMEYVSTEDDGAVLGTYHHGESCGKDDWVSRGGKESGKLKGPDWSADFHVYEIEWNETALVWRVDGGEPYYSFPSNDWSAPLPDAPMYWILNTAISPYLDAPDPAAFPLVFEIDWVRVWQRREDWNGIGSAQRQTER